LGLLGRWRASGRKLEPEALRLLHRVRDRVEQFIAVVAESLAGVVDAKSKRAVIAKEWRRRERLAHKQISRRDRPASQVATAYPPGL
jgi:hypothetical protein